MRPASSVPVVAVAIVALFPISAFAQRPLSLADAQAEARMHAPETAELQARIAEAEAIAAQASRRLREDPTVSSSFVQGRLVGRPDEHAWSLGFNQPFDISRSWRPRAASTAADVERRRQERDDGLRALDERVAVAVADLALAQRQIARSQQIADLHRLATDAVRQQFQVGTAPQIDADSAEIDFAIALASVEQAQGDVDQSRARLARLLGRETGRDLVVEDVPEAAEMPSSPPDFAALIERDPRVRAAAAEVDAATFERQMFDRLITPPVSVGADYGRQTREIPAGSFVGSPLAGLLAANWTDAELVFNVSVGVPLFNRQREPRARATGRILMAEARLRTVRADVRAELESSWAALQAAARAFQRVAATTAIIDRDAAFVEQAVTAGAFDTLTRTQELRRLQDAGRRVDTAVRDLRAARAAWLRRVTLAP
jgi:cobalt-zinc-cadmium efflux system outer membrane protein